MLICRRFKWRVEEGDCLTCHLNNQVDEPTIPEIPPSEAGLCVAWELSKAADLRFKQSRGKLKTICIGCHLTYYSANQIPWPLRGHLKMLFMNQRRPDRFLTNSMSFNVGLYQRLCDQHSILIFIVEIRLGDVRLCSSLSNMSCVSSKKCQYNLAGVV